MREVRTLMIGLDNSGKTSMLYRMTTGALVQTIPTIGFNVETIHFRHLDVRVLCCLWE